MRFFSPLHGCLSVYLLPDKIYWKRIHISKGFAPFMVIKLDKNMDDRQVKLEG